MNWLSKFLRDVDKALRPDDPVLTTERKMREALAALDRTRATASLPLPIAVAANWARRHPRGPMNNEVLSVITSYIAEGDITITPADSLLEQYEATIAAISWADTMCAMGARSAYSAGKFASAHKAALVSMLAGAPWGRQPDGSFVTIRRDGWDARYVRALHAPGRGGQLAEIRETQCRPRAWYLASCVTPDEARATADKARANRRRANAEYDAALTECARRIVLGEPPPFCDGREGGYYRLSDDRTVSARGALRRAERDGWMLLREQRVYAPRGGAHAGAYE